MVCSGLETLTENTILAIMQFPTSCDYYFYLKIMAALFIIIALGLYEFERRREIKPDFLSCAGVSAIAVMVLSIFGSLLTIISSDILLEIITVGLIIIILWIIKK